MTTTGFTTTISVDNSPEEVFNAVNDVRGWWHGEVDGDTHNLNSEFTYRMRDMHFSRQQIVELQPNKRIVWLVTDSKLSFTDAKNEWTGTKIIFEISEARDKTELRFTHAGLVPEFECYGGCSNGWEMLIHKSLFSLLTTGKGTEVFN
ncbi:MAG: SRPBCC domain-containing protein [Flavobacterium sp.]|nr:MAG: SRPBCC domain-containing protein [Flavobacterium sp.]